MYKSILERGIDDLRDDVDEAIERYPEVQEADENLNVILESLQKRLSYKNYVRIEEAITVARSEDSFAAFRVGVTEGMKLANSVRALLASEGVGRHE